MKSPTNESVRLGGGADASSQVADIFLLHGGLQYLPTDQHFLSSYGCVNRQFQRQARSEFNERLRRCHPSLVAAVGSDDIDSIGWRDWCRFEMDEVESREMGEHLYINGVDIEDYDILLEVKKKEGTVESVVWHGVEPLMRGARDGRRRRRDCPDCNFTLPHISFDAPKPTDEDREKFWHTCPFFPERQLPSYWCGLRDCSLQQKSICKALYGINSPRVLCVHVVMRRRSDGKMLTVLSTDLPNQIVGEDYGNSVGHYEVTYDSVLFQDGEKGLYATLSFDFFCSEELENASDLQIPIQFSSQFEDDNIESDYSNNGSDVESENNYSNEGETGAEVNFRFYVMDEGDQRNFAEKFFLKGIRALKWS